MSCRRSPRFRGGEHLSRVDGPGSCLLLRVRCIERLAESHLVADCDLSGSGDLDTPSQPPSPGVLIRRCYDQSGPTFPAHLRGPLSSALWLPRVRRLVLATDRFGFRRLYYAVTPIGVAFSSRVRGPLALAGSDSSLEPDAIYAYLNFNTVPAPQTPYRWVRAAAARPRAHLGRWPGDYPALLGHGVRRTPTLRDGAAMEMRHHTREAVRRAPLRGGQQAHWRLPERRHRQQHRGGIHESPDRGASPCVFNRVREERYNELRYAELAAATSASSTTPE
jgi:hypothetical protein